MEWVSFASYLQMAFIVAFAVADTPATRSYFINGGYIETANYSIHEAIIPIFQKYLLNDLTVLNAGGPTSLIVPILPNGTIKRNGAGVIILEKTLLNAQAATKSNVKKIFEELSSFSGKLTIVFGDHGSNEGICLWNNERLSSTELQRLYSKLEPNTLVRVVHLHCYSGAAMVSKERTLPKKEEDWKNYLSTYFRPNSCALGMSLHDEVSVYYGWPTGQAWETLLKENRPKNLVELKKLFISDDRFTSTPVLTSDYLISDIKKFICNSYLHEKHGAVTKESHFDMSLKSRPMLIENQCNNSSIEKRIIELEEKYKEVSNKLYETQRLIRRIAKVVLEYYGGLSAEIQISTRQKIEKLKADFALSLMGREPTIEEEMRLEQEINKLRINELIDYENKLESVVWGFYLNDEMQQYFKSDVFKKWFEDKGKNEFPVAYKILNDPEYKNQSIFLVESSLSKERTAIQKERKILITKQQEINKKFVLSFINRFNEIKETYDSIKNCEFSDF